MKVSLLSGFLMVAAITVNAGVSTSMQDLAKAFLDSLDDSQLAKAKLALDDGERENYRFTPGGRAGIPLKELTATQREKACALLSSALSEKGLLKVEQILLLEAILGQLTNRLDFRDPEMYFIAVFGKPDATQPWGWRFEGHHLSLNFTLVRAEVTVTPSFLGANPAEVPSGEHRGLRVLEAEEDLARALVLALLADGNVEVVFSDSAPRDVLTGEQREVASLDPVGVAAAEMSGTQQEVLRALIDEYVSRHRTELAAAEWEKIEEAGFDEIRFGWAGDTARGGAYYYRIQGPTFLMEAANTQNNANHVHTTWRDLKNDFGRDALADHYRSHEH